MVDEDTGTVTARQRVTRAPSDVLRLAVAAVSLALVVVVALLFDEAVVGFANDLLRGLDALPEWLVTATVVLGQALAAVLLVAAVVVTIRSRAVLVGATAAASAVVAALLFVVLVPAVDLDEGEVASVDEAVPLLEPDAVPSGMAVAVTVAVVTAVAPWLSRRWRRAAWALAVLVALIRFLGAPVGFDTLTAYLAGWTAGAAGVVLFGAPSQRPTAASIGEGLARVGVRLARLEPAAVDARGSTPYFGATDDGTPLFVKALGADERSADLLFRVYRRLLPHDLGDERAFSTLRRAVEHEALVALAAREQGIRTPRLVGFATAAPHSFVLAYEAIDGRSLDRVDADELTDDLLDAVWAQLAEMRSAGIAHRDLRLANVFLAADGAVWMIDFGFSELAASDTLLANDLAELLASSATLVGPDRALAAARRALTDETLATALARLRPAMLSGATRSALRADASLLPSLRTALESPRSIDRTIG